MKIGAQPKVITQGKFQAELTKLHKVADAMKVALVKASIEMEKFKSTACIVKRLLASLVLRKS